MKALALKTFGEMEIIELEDPITKSGEVTVDIWATGICGSDLHGFTGENGRRFPGQIMGHESVGHVASVGEGVTGLKIGQPVTFNPVIIPETDIEAFQGREQMSPNKQVVGVTPELTSSFAQKISLPSRNIFPLPESMPLALGALIEPLAVAVHAVRRAQTTPEDKVLVLGGGPIGQSVVLALQMAGVKSIAVTEIMDSRRSLLSGLGVEAVDPSKDTAAEEVKQALGGLADVAIDAVGIDPTIHTALSTTRIGATICLVGMGSPELSLDAFKISTEERTLTGSFTYSVKDFQDAANWMGTAPSSAEQLISREVPISEGPLEFTKLAQGHDTPGKVLVRLND
jgi:threonine dehydrogenase-like Zn-dependent dehydrogenase